MQITVNGVDRIRERIDKLAKLQEKCAEVARRLCEVGEPIIRAAHGNHATVMAAPIESGYAITADGDQRLLIIEFGAGDATGIMAGEYDEVPSVVRPGSWSKCDVR